MQEGGCGVEVWRFEKRNWVVVVIPWGVNALSAHFLGTHCWTGTEYWEVNRFFLHRRAEAG